MGVFLIVLGFAVNSVCGIVILIKAFRVSVGWGFAVLFLPFAALFFVLNHWNDTRTPFLAGLGGAALMVFGFLGIAASAPEPQETVEAREPARGERDVEEERRATYASAAAAAPTPVSYEPPRSAYQPPVVTYDPPPAPAPVATSEPQAPPEDDWRPKPKFEQVYVDRSTNQYYAESCNKRPENVYRVPRTIAISQGMTEAACP